MANAGARDRIATARRTVALLRPHATGERGRLMAGATLGVIAVALHVARPWPLKWILDDVAGQAGRAPSWPGVTPGERIAVLTALLVVISLAASAAEFWQTMLLNGVGNRVSYRLRASLFMHLLRQPLAFHESREVGELLTRVVYDTSRLRRGVNGALINLVQPLALFAATLVVLFLVDASLGTLLAGGGIVALLVMRRRGGRIARAARRQRKREGRLAALVARELAGVRELQALGADAGVAQRRFDARSQRSVRREQKVQRLAAGLVFGVEAILAVALAIALWVGTHAVIGGRLGPGDLVLFISYAAALRGPFIDFARQTARLGRTAACAERLARLAEREPRRSEGGAVAAPPLRGAISFDRVSAKSPRRSRSARKWALRKVSFELPEGRRTAIVGGNGAGKSTLLRLALRLAEPSRGVVRLDGRDLGDYEIGSVRRQMSVVLQGGVLPGMTIRENIALGTADASEQAVHEAAIAARAHDFISRLPDGYDTSVRRGGALLSGGERQRIAIARALLRDGTVWLLDEPMAELDAESARAITEVLFRATEGRTTLWVTHDPSIVARFDWVLALDHGALTYAGPAEAFGHLPAGVIN